MFQNRDVVVNQRPALNKVDRVVGLKNMKILIVQIKKDLIKAELKTKINDKNSQDPAESFPKNLTSKMIAKTWAIGFRKNTRIQEMMQNSTRKNTINGNINFDL